MAANFDKFLYIPKCILGTLDTIFHGQQTFGLVRGSLSWSKTPYFHKGGPLRMAQKLAVSAEV